MIEIDIEELQRRDMPEKVELRLRQVKFNMEDEIKADALVVTNLPNIRYLTNFSGSAATLFIASDAVYFVTDDRYEEQVKLELFRLPNMRVFITRDPWALVKDGTILKDIESIAFEADKMSYYEAVQLRNLVKPIKMKPASRPVELYTLAKTPEEIGYIETACQTAEKVYEIIKPMIKVGAMENDLAAEITYQGRKLGSEADAFDVIFVSGERGALVHGKPSNKRIESGDIVLMDFGCVINGFVSDISRTVAVEKATDDQKQMYKLLYAAQQKAIEGIRPGANGKNIDALARDMIAAAGYGEYFQHSLGHGIGLVEHEAPILTHRMTDQIIPEHCALAVEPGVYLPNKYGMRVEDDVLVIKGGTRLLTHALPELEIVG
ncbi:MAG: Xaa-Pro peptidase family protein [Candidatus Kapabacteria bacterium]|nr:Xaa-Pro peptidase family protein [Candidatus Kapabacteria bacterium]